MGVEHGDIHFDQSERNPGLPGTEFIASPPAVEVPAESPAVAVEVFYRVVELQRQLEEAQAKAAKLDARRASDRERFRLWRANHLETARQRSRESVRASRARRRQADS